MRFTLNNSLEYVLFDIKSEGGVAGCQIAAMKYNDFFVDAIK